jgi:hypothetical protein
MFERIPISLWGSGGESAVHPAATVRHRLQLAPAPAPCPRSTSRAKVHGQFALHGVDPLISIDPHPPGLDGAVPLGTRGSAKDLHHAHRQQFGTQMPQGGHPPHHSITSSARASSLSAAKRRC